MQFASAISSSTRLGASGIFDRVFSPVVQQLSVAKIRLQADSEPFMHMPVVVHQKISTFKVLTTLGKKELCLRSPRALTKTTNMRNFPC